MLFPCDVSLPITVAASPCSDVHDDPKKLGAFVSTPLPSPGLTLCDDESWYRYSNDDVPRDGCLLGNGEGLRVDAGDGDGFWDRDRGAAAVTNADDGDRPEHTPKFSLPFSSSSSTTDISRLLRGRTVEAELLPWSGSKGEALDEFALLVITVCCPLPATHCSVLVRENNMAMPTPKGGAGVA